MLVISFVVIFVLLFSHEGEYRFKPVAVVSERSTDIPARLIGLLFASWKYPRAATFAIEWKRREATCSFLLIRTW